jgi:hypothetical protein
VGFFNVVILGAGYRILIDGIIIIISRVIDAIDVPIFDFGVFFFHGSLCHRKLCQTLSTKPTKVSEMASGLPFCP